MWGGLITRFTMMILRGIHQEPDLGAYALDLVTSYKDKCDKPRWDIAQLGLAMKDSSFKDAIFEIEIVPESFPVANLPMEHG